MLSINELEKKLESDGIIDKNSGTLACFSKLYLARNGKKSIKHTARQ